MPSLGGGPIRTWPISFESRRIEINRTLELFPISPGTECPRKAIYFCLKTCAFCSLSDELCSGGGIQRRIGFD